MTTGYWPVFVVIATWASLASVAATAAPLPDGQYAVGMVRAEFVDPLRRLETGDPASGPRRLPAIVWYPAAGHAAGGDAIYMGGAAATVTLPAIARNFGYTVQDLHAMTVVRLGAQSGATPARHPWGFPVVVFSHGFFLYPEQNSALAARLASQGYIVVSIAHPGDAADLRLKDGRIVATKLASGSDDARFAARLKSLVAGTDLATCREALTGYAEAFAATRLGRSLAEWRDDTLAVTRAILDKNEPQELHEVLSTANRSRLAFAGMSFGGATSATTCRLVDACRAAVNLDGQNFDPGLFDHPVGRPLLLMLSDWVRYGLLEGQPRAANFSPNDLAYESWNEVGKNRDVVRVRLEGIRHLGFTDLVTLLQGSKRQERVGELDADEALSAISDLVLAFLDAYVRDNDVAGIDRAIEHHASLRRHTPARLQRWLGGTE